MNSTVGLLDTIPLISVQSLQFLTANLCIYSMIISHRVSGISIIQMVGFGWLFYSFSPFPLVYTVKQLITSESLQQTTPYE